MIVAPPTGPYRDIPISERVAVASTPGPLSHVETLALVLDPSSRVRDATLTGAGLDQVPRGTWPTLFTRPTTSPRARVTIAAFTRDTRTLRRAVTDPDPCVRAATNVNPGIRIDAQRALLTDPDPAVRLITFQRTPNYSKVNLLTVGPLPDPDADTEFVARCCAHDDVHVRAAAARTDRDLTAEQAYLLATDPDARVRSAARAAVPARAVHWSHLFTTVDTPARHRITIAAHTRYQHTITRAVTDPDPYIRAAAARNPRTRAPLLAVLADDADPLVRDAVQATILSGL